MTEKRNRFKGLAVSYILGILTALAAFAVTPAFADTKSRAPLPRTVKMLVNGKTSEVRTVLYNNELFVHVRDAAREAGCYDENPTVPDLGLFCGAKARAFETDDAEITGFAYNYCDIPEDFRWSAYFSALAENGWRFNDAYERDGMYAELYEHEGGDGEPAETLTVGEVGGEYAYVMFRQKRVNK